MVAISLSFVRGHKREAQRSGYNDLFLAAIAPRTIIYDPEATLRRNQPLLSSINWRVGLRVASDILDGYPGLVAVLDLYISLFYVRAKGL